MPTATTAPPRPSTVYRRLMERLPVRTPRRTIVPMQFNTAQERLWEHVKPCLDAQQPIRLIILKARHLGMSTWIENLLTCLCFFQNYTQAMIVAHEADATARIWDMSRRFAQESALRSRAEIRKSDYSIGFRQSTLTMATAGSPNASRSADLTACHLSEVAFWKQPGAMLAILQCLPREEGVFSVAVIESTANGIEGPGALFHDRWQAASEGDSDFTPVFLPWHCFPLYTSENQAPLRDLTAEEEQLKRDLGLTWGQLRWRRSVIANDCQGSVKLFNQEYPATPHMAFIVSGLTFFDPEQLLWLEPYMEQGIRGRLVERGATLHFERETHGRLTIFRPPIPGRRYIIGADSALGYGTAENQEYSKSAATVLDEQTLEQVAEYSAPAAPHVFAQDLAYLGRAYNMALLAPEVQANGGGGGKELVAYLRDDYNYHNLYWRRRPEYLTRGGEEIIYGWETNSSSRPRMIARIQEAMHERSSVIHSRLLSRQLHNFGENSRKRLVALVGNDDALFAYGIALVARSEHAVAQGLGQRGGDAQEGRIDITQAGYKVRPAWEEDTPALRDLARANIETTQPQEFLAW